MASQDLSPVVSIMAIILLIITIAAVAGRLFTKGKVVGALSLDDYTILGAALFCTGQTVAILVASANGIGHDWSSLSGSQKEDFLRAFYASGLLFIVSTMLAKLSVVLFIGNLAPIDLLKKMGYGLQSFLVLWGVASLLAASFQCRTLRVWDYPANTCYDLRAFWLSFDSISLLLELVIVIWPSVVVSRLQTNRTRRAIFITCFATRALVVGAIIAQIIYTSRRGKAAYGASPSFDLWSITVCEQIVQCVSIITACVPQFRPFLLAMESGFLTARAGERSTYAQRSKDSKSHSSGSHPSEKSTKARLMSAFRSNSHAWNNSQPTPESLEEGSGRPSAVALIPVDSTSKENHQSSGAETGVDDKHKGVETSRVQFERY